MATISKGILGGFSGKVGTVVGANWRGKDIIRSVPKTGHRTATDKQLLQQMKFKLVVTFLQPLKSIQNLYFGSESGAKSRVNLAVSYTINEAVQVVDDLPELVYSKVLITKGDLAGFQSLTATPQSGGILQLSWEDNTVQGNASATDRANVVAYCEELEEFIIWQSVALRSEVSASVTLPSPYVGKEVHLWAYFNNEAETQACNSPYVGTVTVL